ncbi:hypothetical protein [Agrobacterium vitis]|uniref:hypothetical protein n=1 Tax=Agrobacterium vitis TaxID=373 RepID=UPI0012E83C82|nr:hypothetical protein [Agrobacterium vitis]MVA33628.1 hypothetical protein [Agrobacterium vitis]
MSRPWNKGTPAPHLQPVILGQFETFNDWVDSAQRALTGFTGSVGEELKPICIDNIGRRCNVGKDFMRARDEGAFPVRYFVEMEPRAVTAIQCGGEAPPVYVVAMEQAPAPPSTLKLEPGRLYESHNFGLVEYIGLDRFHGETTHEFRINGASGFHSDRRYAKPEKLFDFLKPLDGSAS